MSKDDIEVLENVSPKFRRDLFAAAALMGTLACEGQGKADIDELCEQAWYFADAMLEADG